MLWCVLLAIELNVIVTNTASQCLWVVQWTAALGEGLTKISILLLYKRIFLGKTFIVSTSIVMALCVTWTISFFFSNFCTSTERPPNVQILTNLSRLPTCDLLLVPTTT